MSAAGFFIRARRGQARIKKWGGIITATAPLSVLILKRVSHIVPSGLDLAPFREKDFGHKAFLSVGYTPLSSTVHDAWRSSFPSKRRSTEGRSRFIVTAQA